MNNLSKKQIVNFELPNHLEKPKAILLDWDNTLADSWGVIHKCLNKAFEAYDLEPWSLDDLRNNRGNIHHSLRQSFPRFFGDKWEDARDIYYKHFKDCHIAEIKLLEGADKTIEKLAESDAYVAIVSNKTGQYLRDELEHLKISDHFDAIIGATDAKNDKPYADPLHLALEKSEMSKNDFSNHVWMVGDSKTDIEAAKNFGCKGIQYGSAVLESEYDDHIHFKISCHNHFSEVADWLLKE
jgi:phosphoglycolate phosphatase